MRTLVMISIMAFSKRGIISGTLLAICFNLALSSALELSSISSENIVGDNGIEKLVLSKEKSTAFVRKLLASPVKLDADDEGKSAVNRAGGKCSLDNIVIIQGPGTPLPSGIPTYSVQVMNVCVTGCSISNIHFHCGVFSSAHLIDPAVFRRIAVDDCLVNNGRPLGAGQSLKFLYADTFPYDLSVSSLTCL